jgi:hypothetical protein
MSIYCARNNDSVVEREVVDLDGVAGEIACLECGGTGDWTPYLPPAEPGPQPCIDCKGTGRMLVSI